MNTLSGANNGAKLIHFMPLGVAFIAGLVGYVQLQDRVATQAREIEDLKRQAAESREWRTEWSRSGQLPDDVRQNERIAFHETCIERIRERLARLEGVARP